MPDHRFAQSSEVHEPKHITGSTTADSGFVITPSSSTNGTSELRQLSLSDLADGADTVTETTLENNDKFNYQGWENVEDALVTTPDIAVTSTPTLLTIDDEGVSNDTNRDYLPNILAIGESLWDVANSKITPAVEGDTYLIRLNLGLTNPMTSPTVLTVELDVGSGSGPTNVRSEKVHFIEKVMPYNISFTFPVFITDTFLANGGRFFLSTNAGSLDVTNRSIFISRLSSGTT